MAPVAPAWYGRGPMKPQFEELDYRQTPLGELILQRRSVLALDGFDEGGVGGAGELRAEETEGGVELVQAA